MQIGILGTGNMGEMHAKVFKQIPEVAISGVCGRNVTKTDEFARKIGTKPYTDCQTLLNDKNIDLVDVCLPVDLHCEWVIKAYDPYFAECKYMVECIGSKAEAELLDLESVSDSMHLIFLARESLRQGGVKIGVD